MAEIKFEEIVLASWLHDIDAGNFIDSNKNAFPDGINLENVKLLAANWKNPSTYWEEVISIADSLADGKDFSVLEKEQDPPSNANFPGKPMVQILSSLHLDGREEPKNAFCKMEPLEGENIIPEENCEASKEKYFALWEKFEADFKKLAGLNYNQFLLSLNSLLERYWWCVPSAANADISLYQHAKTTAAFAASLYLYQKENGAENEASLKTDGKKFLFVNGDISGIQKYIFDLKTSADNAKLLRAKSFQLMALGEILSQFIVKKFGVTYANIMTSAGGKFIVLLPNTKSAKELLPKIQLEVEEYLLNEFAGKLSCIISGGTEAAYSDLRKDKVVSLLNRIGDDADKAKSKKMQKALAKYGAVLNAHYEDLQRNGECPKCGIFAASKPEGSDDDRECGTCRTLIDVGGKLVKSAKITLYSDALKPFGEMIHFYRDDENPRFFYSINDYKPGFPLMNLPYVAPKDEKGGLLTFEKIADKSKGNKKIAMFKSDVDNLGLVFSSSLGKRMSFARYSDLSHMLHFFFSSFYAWFVENNKDQNGDFYKDKIYTVFSGGDDLCVLGSWDSILQFALDFKKELDKFTNKNPSVMLSGGIVLSSSNVPVRNIAEAAEENLEKSKSRTDAGGKTVKNAITVFGATVSWKDYEKLLEEGKFIEEKFDSSELSTGVIYKFLDFAGRAEKSLGKKRKIADVSELVNPKDRIWKSNLVYILARNVKDESLKERLLKLGENPESMINSRVAVSYALYTQRKN